MRLLIGCALLLLALRSFASTQLTTQIHQIDRGETGEAPIVLLKSGLVAKVDPQDLSLVAQLEEARRKNSWINFSLDYDRTITAVETVPSPENQGTEVATGEEKGILYSPSVIPTLKQAHAVFKNMNRRYNDESQCYNRAHVWSWEMYQKHHIRSMKTYVFFSPKYIRRYTFEWWFHVAPYVHVYEDGQVVERVMDRRYSSTPKTMKEWTDIFMHNNAECPTIAKYTDYEFKRGEADAPWCWLLKVPMYYYQPLDLEALDKENKVRQFWEEWEVGNAYREAFSYRSETR